MTRSRTGWPGVGEPYYLVGGHLIDGTGADPVDEAFVLVDGGRVGAVGRSGDLTRSQRQGRRLVDVGGRWILPGLIDCHTHLVYAGYHIFDRINSVTPEMATVDCVRNARTLLRAGYTTVRDLGTVGNAAVAIRDAVAAGKLAGPRVIASGRSICTTAGPKHALAPAPGGGFRQYADGPDGVVRAVREQIRAGVDNIKLVASGVENNPHVFTRHTTMSEQEMRAGVAEAHRSGRTVAVHAQSYDSVKFALRAGADTIEHGTRLDEESVDLFRSSGSFLVPTLSTLYSVMELGETLDLLPKQRQEMAVNQPLWLTSFRLARESGVPIAAGGDIGNRYPQGMNAREIELLAANGLSPIEAVTAATGGAARAIGRHRQLGSLTPGRLADLIVVDADPLADLSVLADTDRIRVVVRSGVAVSGADFDADPGWLGGTLPGAEDFALDEQAEQAEHAARTERNGTAPGAADAHPCCAGHVTEP